MQLGEVWIPGVDPQRSYGERVSPAELQAANAAAQSEIDYRTPAFYAIAAIVAFLLLSGAKK